MIRQAGRAYSQDLRDRVIAAADGGMAVREAAPLFRVSISYIYKALIRRRLSGETRPRAQRNHVPPKLAGHEETLRREIERRSETTISELRAFLAKTQGVSVSHATLWKTLDRLGLTYKKRRFGQPSRIGLMSRKLAASGASGSRS